MISASTIAVAGTLAGIAGVFWTYASFIAPRLKRAVDHKLKQIELEQAMRDVLLGRAEGPSNPVTGERGMPALPGIAERLTAVAESQHAQDAKLFAIHEELKAANEKRFKDLESNVKALQHQVNRLHKIIEVKAEAEADLFPAMLDNMMRNNDEPS